MYTCTVPVRTLETHGYGYKYLQHTLNDIKHSAKYFFNTESLASRTLRDKCVRCLKGLASTTFSKAEDLSAVKVTS